jgi:hypothetical protein
MEHYNSVARTLMERPDRYSPLFPSILLMATSSGSSGSRVSRRPSRYVRQPGKNSSTPMSKQRNSRGDEWNAAARRYRPGRQRGEGTRYPAGGSA